MGIFSIRWVNERTTKDEPLKFGMNIPKCLPYNLLEVDFRYIDSGNFQVNLTTFLVVYSNDLALNVKVGL